MLKLGVAMMAAAGLLVTPVCCAFAAEESPLKSAKVGDWVEAKITNEMGEGRKHESTMKTTVSAKDATSVTLKMEITMAGRKMPPQESKIDLTQPYDPVQAAPGAKVEQLGQGDENLTVGGKTYACHWVKFKMTMPNPPGGEGVGKVWSSKDVPVYGMVKSETETTIKMGKETMKTKTTQLVTGYGRGK